MQQVLLFHESKQDRNTTYMPLMSLQLIGTTLLIVLDPISKLLLIIVRMEAGKT
jgi:hypothetical protein